MEASVARGEEGTAALLRFAEDGGELASFDDANVSAGQVGARGKEQAWWDQQRAGLRLSGRDLSGASLSRANLTQANLSGAQLPAIRGVGMVLVNACLEGADLTGADLIGADLSTADAGEANFSEALLEDGNLRGAQLRFANFEDAILDGANFSRADLWGARMRKVAAERTGFRNARLDEANLVEGEFSTADFTGATLRKADLSGARLRGADLREVTLDGAKMVGCDLTGAVLPNVSLITCDLTGTRFAGAWLERTRMQAKQIGRVVGEEEAGDLEGALDSYIVLERNFISLGNVEDASWAYRRRRRVGRALHWKRMGSKLRTKNWRGAVGSMFAWLGDTLAEWLCDYGESVLRVVRSFFVLLIGFALVYWVTGSLRAREGFTSSHRFAVVNYLLFSLDSMTTVGTSEVALRPAGEVGMLLSSLQTVLGTTLLGLFGFVLGARIRK